MTNFERITLLGQLAGALTPTNDMRELERRIAQQETWAALQWRRWPSIAADPVLLHRFGERVWLKFVVHRFNAARLRERRDGAIARLLPGASGR